MDIQRLSQYLDFPIQPPPPGVTPNFTSPESNAYQMYITAGCVGSAFGKHSWDVRLGAFTKPQLVITLLVENLLPLALCLVKVSVLMLYLQVFRVLKWMRIACCIGIGLIAAFHISFSIAFGAMCAPRIGTSQLDFLAALVSSSCDHTRVLVLLQGVGSVLVDFFLLILPLPAIWGLQMPLARKLALLSMFMVGFCACASSIISLVFRAQYWVAGNDNTWLVVPLWVTTMAEVTAGVMICCMPTTAALFKSVQMPVRSWITSRLTGSNRSGLPLFGDSNSRLKYSLESRRKDGQGDNAAWVDSREHGYSMYRIDAPKPGVWKRTEVEVSRTI